MRFEYHSLTLSIDGWGYSDQQTSRQPETVPASVQLKHKMKENSYFKLNKTYTPLSFLFFKEMEPNPCSL
uniref:Uncharacterized protein n=1 Tax=Anguilla anguilla TaxID=7936 RepID=A0A0E9XUY0_ANGAN